MKADTTWMHSLVHGGMKDDAEAMRILKSILPEMIIKRIQVPASSALLLPSPCIDSTIPLHLIHLLKTTVMALFDGRHSWKMSKPVEASFVF